MEDRIIKLFKIVLLFILSVIALFLLGLLIQTGLNINDSLKNWDPLAFLGAIIGGFITLIGVRITIRNQYKSDFIREHPKKLKNGSDVFKELQTALDQVSEAISSRDAYKLSIIATDIVGRSDELVTKASEVNQSIYFNTDSIITTFIRWDLWLMSAVRKELSGQQDIFYMISLDIPRVQNNIIEIGLALDKEINHYDSILRE